MTPDQHSNTFQIFNPATGAWSANRPIGTWPSGIGVYSPLYPSLHLLANGQLFYSGAHVFAAGPEHTAVPLGRRRQPGDLDGQQRRART